MHSFVHSVANIKSACRTPVRQPTHSPAATPFLTAASIPAVLLPGISLISGGVGQTQTLILLPINNATALPILPRCPHPELENQLLLSGDAVYACELVNIFPSCGRRPSRCKPSEPARKLRCNTGDPSSALQPPLAKWGEGQHLSSTLGLEGTVSVTTQTPLQKSATQTSAGLFKPFDSLCSTSFHSHFSPSSKFKPLFQFTFPLPTTNQRHSHHELLRLLRWPGQACPRRSREHPQEGPVCPQRC